MDPEDFYRPWEWSINSFDDIEVRLTTLFERWVKVDRRLFAWRGVVDAAWPLHSSLYRRTFWTSTAAKAPDETALLRREGEVLTSVDRWGLHDGDRGRLSILAQLATIQHFGAPTRLIDVTMNAYIGLWFAVQPVFRNGQPVNDMTDGRLFAVDITNRLINEDDVKRDWETASHRPWKDDDAEWGKQWCSQTWAWRPPAFERRIAAQNGALLFGGVPRTGVGIAWPKGTAAGSGWWPVDDVRRCVSLPLRFHVAQPRAGGVCGRSALVHVSDRRSGEGRNPRAFTNAIRLPTFDDLSRLLRFRRLRRASPQDGSIDKGVLSIVSVLNASEPAPYALTPGCGK